MTTYELTINSTSDDFFNARSQLINEFIQQITNAEVTADWRNPRTGRIVSCYNPCNNFNSIIASVYFDDTDETKNYGIVAAINCGGLLFVDESMKALYDEFVEANENIKHQEFLAAQEAQRREKDAAKKAEQLKKAEAKSVYLKEKAIKDFEELTHRAKKAITEADEFYYGLGWLAAHIGSISATMPDYLAGAFEKHFGTEAAHRVVDSAKRTVNGNSMQWTFGFKATLKNPDSIPATLAKYLSSTGKAIANTSFIWDLVTDYGFKFGKKQDALDIMRCVPIEYVPMFNAGMEA